MKTLRLIPEAYAEPFASSDTDVGESAEKFHKNIKDMQQTKLDIISHCTRILKQAEEEAELKSIALNEEFRRTMKHVLKECDAEREEIDFLDEQETALLAQLTELEDALIEIEMNLQEKLSESVNEFSKKLNAITESMRNRVSLFI